MSYLKGIDISKWQAITPSLTGLSFLFARASIGLLDDDKYDTHIANARSHGLLVGAYHFGDKFSTGVKQAQHFLTAAGDVDFYALDQEGANQMPVAEAKLFIAYVRAHGKKAGLYHSDSGFPSFGQDYNWVAHWGTTTPPVRPWKFWQYRGSPLDLDYFNGTTAQLKALSSAPPAIVPPDTSTGDTMSYPVPSAPSIGTVAKGKVIYTTDALLATDPNRIIIDPGRDMPYFGQVNPKARVVEYINASGVHSGKSYFVATADLTNIRPVPVAAPPADTSPYTQAQLDAAKVAAAAAATAAATAAAEVKCKATTATAVAAATVAGVAQGKTFGKADEAARIRGVLGI